MNGTGSGGRIYKTEEPQMTDAKAEKPTCERCEGHGEVPRPGVPLGEPLMMDDWVTCPVCNGMGEKP